MPRLFEVLDQDTLAEVTSMASPEVQALVEAQKVINEERVSYLRIVPHRSTYRTPRKQMRREILLRRDGNLCWVCRSEFTEKNPPTLDHVLELSRGGRDRLDNIKLAHQKCNARRSNKKHSLLQLANARVKHDNLLRSA